MTVKQHSHVPRGLVIRSKILLIIPCAFVVGCGEDWRASTHPAEGKIVINDTVPEGAVITLHPLGQPVDQRDSQPWAIVDAEGSYTLQTYEKGDGAPAGEYHVAIRWPWDVNDMSKAMTDRLGKAYSDPQKSQWKFTITEGTNQLPLIEIEDAELHREKQNRKNRNQPVMPVTGNG